MHRTIALFALLFSAACSGSSASPGADPGMGGSAGAGTPLAGAAGLANGGGGMGVGGGSSAGVAGVAGTLASAGGQGGTFAGSGGASGNGGMAGGAPLAGAAGVAGNANAGMGGGGAPNLPRKVLMVGLSTGKPSPGDAILIKRLEGRGFQVTLVADTAVTAASADGKDLVLISSSEESGNLGTKLRDLSVPTLCMEDGSFADMKMASARGHALNTTALEFIGKSALGGGLSGSVTIADAPPDPGDMGWGTVGTKAIVAATVVGKPEQAALFGYDQGTDMVGMPAPARRVGFAAREAVASHFTEQGLKVFDRAVDWTLGLP